MNEKILIDNKNYLTYKDLLMFKEDNLDYPYNLFISGGFRNIIELEDVFKLYYNSDEIINNIYKLYFILKPSFKINFFVIPLVFDKCDPNTIKSTSKYLSAFSFFINGYKMP